MKKLFNSQVKLIYWALILAILFGISHIAFLSLLFAFSFIILLVYNLGKFLIKRKPENIWKLGFLGLTGLIGLLPSFDYGFCGFFSLFGFFALYYPKTPKSF